MVFLNITENISRRKSGVKSPGLTDFILVHGPNLLSVYNKEMSIIPRIQNGYLMIQEMNVIFVMNR